MNFVNVFSKHYKLLNELCKRCWGFTVIYNDDDKNDPRIEFVYRNEYAVVRTTEDAEYWLNVLDEHEPRTMRQAKKSIKKLKRDKNALIRHFKI